MCKYYATLYKELEYPWILLSLSGAQANALQIPRDDCWVQVITYIN